MKLVKVTLITLIVLANTFDGIPKQPQYYSILEKHSPRRLTDPDDATDCEGTENYIIVKYSENVTINLDSASPDPNFQTICSDEKKVTSLEATEFKFYLAETVASLTDIFEKYEKEKISSLDFTNFKQNENLKSLKSLFKGFSKLDSINFGGLDTTKITDMGEMFQNCSSLKSVNLTAFSTSEVTNMDSMFEGSGLEELNLSTFNTEKVESMKSMFERIKALSSLNLSNFNTSKVANMSKMFSECEGLVLLDISNFDFKGLAESNDDTNNDNTGSGAGGTESDPEQTPTPGGGTESDPEQTPTPGGGTESDPTGRRRAEEKGRGRRRADGTSQDGQGEQPKDGGSQDVSSDKKTKSETDPDYRMFYGLNSLKYINIINVTDPNGVLNTSELMEKTSLKACQKESILTKATNQCCTFDTFDKDQGTCPTESVAATTVVVNEVSTAVLKPTTLPTEKATTAPTEEEIILPSGMSLFTIGSINQENCDTTGKLILNGKISGESSKYEKFTLPLSEPSGISLSCSLAENQLDCETDRVINGKITIEATNITKEKNTLILKEYSSEETIKCANALNEKAKNKLKVNIAFRQVSHFETNSQSNSFSFYLITLISEALAKDFSLKLKMLMDISGSSTEKEATCVLQEAVSPSSGSLAQGNFLCTVQLTADEFSKTDFDTVSVSPENEEINGVNDLDETLSNPKKTDEKIKEIKARRDRGEQITDLEYIVDYFEEEVKPTPLFTISDIDMNKCKSNGKFILTGSFSDDIDESIKFDFNLAYPANEVKCEFDEATKGQTIEMTCKLHSAFSLAESIIIEQKLIKKKNKEIFIIQRKEFTFSENAECADYNEAKKAIIEKRMTAKFSFLQLNHFVPSSGAISFFFALSRILESTIFMPTYPLTVKLKFASRRRLRSLDTSKSGVNVGCTLNQTLQTEKSAGYNCKNSDSISGTPKGMELETDEIDNIQGIPDNANPDKMDNTVDYSNLENLKSLDSVPSGDITAIDGKSCQSDGKYTVTLTLSGKNNNLNTTRYDNAELRFAAPESSGICDVDFTSDTSVKMTCNNKEKFYESEIYIERQLIQDGQGIPLFFINAKTSEEKLECDVSLLTGSITNASSSDDSTETDTEGNSIVYHKKSGSGLSGGAIAGIVIAVVVAIAAISAVIVLAKKGVLGGKKTVDTINNNTSVASLGIK